MPMQGDLQVMAIADLIQHNCQDRNTARLTIDYNDQQAILFFKDGAVLHAVLDDVEGEEVIYEILSWSEGHFTLEMDIEPTATTIRRNWSSLLLEGARRLDSRTNLENSTNSIPLDQEINPMATKKKSEQLADALAVLLQESSDIDGAAVVGVDGLVYSANVPQRALDENMVGATSAAVLGLSKRSAEQLKRGKLKLSLIQGEDGNMIVANLNDETLFVGLTPANVNLGMAFAEVRSMIATLSDLL
jgi:predicted regulator of Ras-like GTPase activity (Roadblock/LC7/MglB family)